MFLLIYRLLLPLYLGVVLPGWVIKMARRGGFGSGLLERFAWYRSDSEFEPCGATHVHAVSVGEALLALKLIDAWRQRNPDRCFVLGVATATGHAVAKGREDPKLRVVYQPIDLRVCVRRYLNRFEPSELVLVEGEMWPHLMLECEARGVRVSLVNARMSPRSRRRYEKFANWVKPVFSRLDRVAVQEESDAEIWGELGVAGEKVRVIGSLKFDSGDGPTPTRKPEFEKMLAACRGDRRVILAASTHVGEEPLMASAIAKAGGFPLIVPRHAERRAEVRTSLQTAGFEVALRSDFSPVEGKGVLVVDSTGELRDWTAHADIVVIGKSFLAEGGQNPAEAVQAGKPLLFGPHMENFEPLATRLVEMGAAWRVTDATELAERLKDIIAGNRRPDPELAHRVLSRHSGATGRMIDWLES